MIGRQFYLLICCWVLGKSPTPVCKSCPEYVDNLQQTLAEIHVLARSEMLKASDRQKRVYDNRANANSYQQGEKVYVFDSTRKKGLSPKLQCRWAGPFRVLGKLSDFLYKIEFPNKVKIVHHDRLKPSHEGESLSGKAQPADEVPVSASKHADSDDSGIKKNVDQISDSVAKSVDLCDSEGESESDELLPSPTVTRSGRKVQKPERFGHV